MPLNFLANHNTIIWGASGVGKTTFMLRIIKEKLIYPFPKLIYYMYRVRQDFMDKWNLDKTNPPIKFIENLNFDELDNNREPCILVIDDLLLSTNKDTCEQFILGSHHKKISTFFLTQSLFPKDDMFRCMSQNTHYFVLFNNQRNFRQLLTLARQAFTKKDVELVESAYKRSLQTPRGFIILTFNPLIPQELAILTDFWEKYPSVYLQ